MRSTLQVCSRFDFCSANLCPLDPEIVKRGPDEEEDPKCEMAKATRHAYWISMPPELRSLLPFQGYFKAEFTRIGSARARWESMSEGQKATVRSRLESARIRAQNMSGCIGCQEKSIAQGTIRPDADIEDENPERKGP